MKHILTLVALAGALSLAACDRRPADPTVPTTTNPPPSGTTTPSTTAPPMPPASAASQ